MMWNNFGNCGNCCCEKPVMQEPCKQSCVKKEIKCCEKTCDYSKGMQSNMMHGGNSQWM